MRDKYLPIGSVVILKEAKKRVMITGYCAVDNDNPEKVFDYSACLFPEGILSSSQLGLFNHEQIDKIIFLGLEDEEVTAFTSKIKEALGKQNNESEIMPKLSDIDLL